MKTLIAAAVMAMMATASNAGMLIKSITYGGTNGSEVSAEYNTGATSADFRQCKAEIEDFLVKDISEYGAIVQEDNEAPGVEVYGQYSKMTLKTITVSYTQIDGHSVYYCMYFHG